MGVCEPQPNDEQLKQQAVEWFERGDHDIETAQLLYNEQGYTGAIAYHIQQAIEKYLKGYLVLIRKEATMGPRVGYPAYPRGRLRG